MNILCDVMRKKILKNHDDDEHTENDKHELANKNDLADETEPENFSSPQITRAGSKIKNLL